ncbi:MAG: transposase [Synergistaceae bacterium]|nr:transposase [Synergistaceae bacterium]
MITQPAIKIVFVLKTGLPWEPLPQEMGCGSGMTCWRYLRDWQTLGVWRKLWHVPQQELCDTRKMDLSRASIDASHAPAKKGRRRGVEPCRSRKNGK